MRKSWLLCVLLGALAWGQAAPGTPPPPAGAPGNFVARPQAAPAPPPDMSASVPPDAAVITVIGVCSAQPKAARQAGCSAKPATAAKAPAAETPAADCKTVITKAEFEKLANAVAPTVTPQLKKQLANVLPRLIAMSSEAKKKGLDKTPRFEETVKFAKMQILNNELHAQHSGRSGEGSAGGDRRLLQGTFRNLRAVQPGPVVCAAHQAGQRRREGRQGRRKDAKLTEEQQKAKQAKEKARARRGRAGDEQAGREPAGAGRGRRGHHEVAERSLRCRRHENRISEQRICPKCGARDCRRRMPPCSN